MTRDATSPSAGAPTAHTARRCWTLYAVAAATFLPAIAFYYVGEEAIFPITSLEMWHRDDWVRHTIYGALVNHPPLFNWMIIPLAAALGWEHVLGVARTITVGATCLTGLVLAGLTQVLLKDRALSAFAALAFLTFADLFFYRGWLAYVDPLFALFVVAAAAALWVACHLRRAAWLWAAVGALFLALLSKSPTTYVFYGLTALVLFVADRGHRRFLLSWPSWAAHASALLLPLAWFYLVPAAAGQDSRAFADIMGKLQPKDAHEYLSKLALFPVTTALRLAPVVFIAAYYGWRRRVALAPPEARVVRLALWIAGLNLLPYWLAPDSHVRYLIPAFPFIALAATWIIWRAGEGAVRVTLRWLTAVVALKLVMVLIAFPYYQHRFRGENYLLAARDIAQRVGDQPLYSTDDTATGMSVTAYVDVLRLPRAPVTFPPKQQWETGFVIAYAPEPKIGQVAHRYRLGGNDLYLLCRGVACAQ